MRRFLTSAAVAALLLVASGCREKKAVVAGEGRITGRVVFQGRGVPGAFVQVYTKPEQDRSTPPVTEAPSGEDGRFELTIAAGRYWVWARATLQEGGRELRLVGQALPNPAEAAPGRDAVVTIDLADPSGFSSSAGPPGAGVRGRVQGAGAARVTIYVYRGRAERPVGPGFAAAVDPDGEGRFSIDLAPGTYTLAVRQRGSGKDYGPPAAGDKIAVAGVEVLTDRYADAGDLRLAPIDAGLLQRRTTEAGAAPTRVQGLIREADGRPAAGVRVLAFRDGRMSGKPVAVSPPSGADGRYSLSLPEGGKYFFGARTRLGGPASPGEKVGQHRGPEGAGVVVNQGDALGGVEITVEEVW